MFGNINVFRYVNGKMRIKLPVTLYTCIKVWELKKHKLYISLVADSVVRGGEAKNGVKQQKSMSEASRVLDWGIEREAYTSPLPKLPLGSIRSPIAFFFPPSSNFFFSPFPLTTEPGLKLKINGLKPVEIKTFYDLWYRLLFAWLYTNTSLVNFRH